MLFAAACGPASTLASPLAQPSAAPSDEPASIETTLRFRADTTRAVESTVTIDSGGTITAMAADGTTFQVVVPPQAVAQDTLIRLIPLVNVDGLGDEPIHAVRLDPEDLELYEWASLTITPSISIPVGSQTMIEADGNGSFAQIALIDPTAEPVVLLLEHFSIGLVGSLTSAQRASFLMKSAFNAEGRINGQIRDRLQSERRARLTGTSETDELPDIGELADKYKSEVVDMLRQSAEVSCDQLMTYLKKAIGFERQLYLLGTLTATEEAESNARVNEAGSLANSRYEECEATKIAECGAASDPSILIRFRLAIGRPADQASAHDVCILPARRVDRTV